VKTELLTIVLGHAMTPLKYSKVINILHSLAFPSAILKPRLSFMQMLFKFLYSQGIGLFG
jgi:hypothetical protein